MPYDKIFENPSTIKMSALFYSDQNRLGKSRILKKNMTKLLKAGEEDSKFLEIIAVEVGRIRTVFMYVVCTSFLQVHSRTQRPSERMDIFFSF